MLFHKKKLISTEKQTDKIVNEYKVVAKQVEGLKLYNEQNISLDTPFRQEERREKVDLVRSSLAKPKVTASEQVSQVLEAYNIEAEYGRKIDTYEDKLEDGTVVNIL